MAISKKAQKKLMKKKALMIKKQIKGDNSDSSDWEDEHIEDVEE